MFVSVDTGLIFTDITKQGVYDQERLADQNHVWLPLKLLAKFHNTSVNVLAYLLGKYGIDCFRMVFVPTITFLV